MQPVGRIVIQSSAGICELREGPSDSGECSYVETVKASRLGTGAAQFLITITPPVSLQSANWPDLLLAVGCFSAFYNPMSLQSSH